MIFRQKWIQDIERAGYSAGPYWSWLSLELFVLCARPVKVVDERGDTVSYQEGYQ